MLTPALSSDIKFTYLASVYNLFSLQGLFSLPPHLHWLGGSLTCNQVTVWSQDRSSLATSVKTNNSFQSVLRLKMHGYISPGPLHPPVMFN